MSDIPSSLSPSKILVPKNKPELTAVEKTELINERRLESAEKRDTMMSANSKVGEILYDIRKDIEKEDRAAAAYSDEQDYKDADLNESLEYYRPSKQSSVEFLENSVKEMIKKLKALNNKTIGSCEILGLSVAYWKESTGKTWKEAATTFGWSEQTLKVSVQVAELIAVYPKLLRSTRPYTNISSNVTAIKAYIGKMAPEDQLFWESS